MSMTDLGGRGTGSGLRWSFVVPKDWWEVPLGNPGQTNAAIKRLVQAQFGYADADGGAKRRVRADLTALAGEAAAAGGRLLVIGHIPVEGAIVSTNTVVYEPQPQPQSSREVEELYLDLAENAPEGAFAERAEFDLGTVARIVTIQRDAIVAPEGPGFEEGHSSLDNLKVEYWVWCEDEKLLLYVVCASPWIPVAESLLVLYDALVNTLVVDVDG